LGGGIFSVFNFARARFSLYLEKNVFWKMKHFRIEKLKESTRHDRTPFRQSLSAIIESQVSATAEQQQRKREEEEEEEGNNERERERDLIIIDHHHSRFVFCEMCASLLRRKREKRKRE